MKFKLILSVAIITLIIPSLTLSMNKRNQSPSIAKTTQDRQKKLFKGTRYNKLREVQEALTEGADVNKKNEIGILPLTILINFNNNSNPEIIDLLLKAGTDANIKDQYGNTPLYSAIAYTEHPNINVIKILLNSGAEVKTKNSKNQTALDAAKNKSFKNEEIVKLLEEWPNNLRKKVKEETSVESVNFFV